MILDSTSGSGNLVQGMSLEKVPGSSFPSCLVGAASALVALTLVLQPQAAVASTLPWQQQLAEGDRRVAAQDLPGAEACFRHALKDVRRSRGRTADDVALCMQRLAQVLQTESSTEEAVPLYKKSLRVLERAHGKNGGKIVPTLLALGSIYEADGDYRRSIELYRRAASIAKQDAGPDSLALADCQYRMGRASFRAGAPSKAEELYRSSLSAIMRQPSLPSTGLLQSILSDYTDLFRKSAEPGRILSSAFQAELLKDRVGSLARTRDIAPSRWNREVLGRLVGDAASKASEEKPGGPPGAIETSRKAIAVGPGMPMSDFAALEEVDRQRVDFYERMIAIDVKSLGANHPSVARDLTGLATVYLARAQYDRAKPLLRRALEIYKGSYGPASLLVERTHSLLNLISEDKADDRDRGAPLTDYLADLPSIPLKARTLEIALRLNYLAFLSYSHARIEDAARFYAWALAATSYACGEQDALVVPCLIDYARVLRSAGREAEAERMESNAHAILRGALVRRAALSVP